MRSTHAVTLAHRARGSPAGARGTAIGTGGVSYSGAMSPRPAVSPRPAIAPPPVVAPSPPVVRIGRTGRSSRARADLGRTALFAVLAVSLIAGCSGDEPRTGAGTPGSGSPTASARPTSARPSQAALPTPKGTAIDVTGLKLGDCFTEPSGELVERITKVDCTGPHDAEIYAVPRLPSSPRYPGDASLEAQADRVCTDASGAVDQDKLPGGATIGYFFPTADNWSAEGSTARCYVATDDQPLVGSVRR